MYMSMFGHDPWKRLEYRKNQQGGELGLKVVGGINQQLKLSSEVTGSKLPFPNHSNLSGYLKGIFAQMLEIDPTKRISWSDLRTTLITNKHSFEEEMNQVRHGTEKKFYELSGVW